MLPALQAKYSCVSAGPNPFCLNTSLPFKKICVAILAGAFAVQYETNACWLANGPSLVTAWLVELVPSDSLLVGSDATHAPAKQTAPMNTHFIRDILIYSSPNVTSFKP
jgi:hypothetical protein